MRRMTVRWRRVIKRIQLWPAILLLLLSATSVSSDDQMPVPQIPYAPRHYVCYRAAEPVMIDGDLNDAAWARTDWTELFTDIQGSRWREPRFRTRAKLLWDSTYLYVAAELQEK